MSSPMPAPRAFCMSPRTPEQLQGDFAIAELERELEELRRKAANQEESLNKYRTEAEMLIGGGAGSSGGAGDGKANGMMKAWLRDAKKQSEELKALFEQSRIVSAESAAIAKRDYEKKVARLRQELEASQAERAAALADKRAAEEAARTAQTQAAISSEQLEMVKLELESSAEKHRALVAQLSEEHKEELSKLATANQQYQQLVREQSQKAASQEKKSSAMFEQTLTEMKTMMERSREMREKERRSASAMLESANEVCDAQKRELASIQGELRKVTEQLIQTELRSQELQNALAETQEQLERKVSEKQLLKESSILSLVQAKVAAQRRRELSCVWRAWATSTRVGTQQACSSEHTARVHGACVLRRQQVADLRAIFIVWRNLLRLLWRGVVIRSKCHSRLMLAALSGWAQVAERTSVRVRFTHQLLRVKNHSLLRHMLTATRAFVDDTKCRRIALTRKGDVLKAQGLRRILIGWSNAAPSNPELQRQARSDEHRATVLAGAFRRQALHHVLLKWREQVRYSQLRVQRVRIIWSRHYQIVAAGVLAAWEGHRARTRRQLRVLTGRVRRSMVLLLTSTMRSWHDNVTEVRNRREEHKDLQDGRKILQQQKDVLTSEVSALGEKLKNAVDALNIAQKVNRVQENELAKVDKMQNETIEKLQKEIEAGKQSLELSRVQCEARESEILAAQAQNSILQETIKELNDIVIELRARVDREETDASSGRVLAQRELHLEQSKAQLLEQQLQAKSVELEAMKRKSEDLQNRVLVLHEESMHHSHVCGQMLSESTLGRSHEDAAAEVFINFQEEVEKQARAELEVKDAEAAAMRAQISLLQAALEEVNLELETARKTGEHSSPGQGAKGWVTHEAGDGVDSSGKQENLRLKATNQRLEQQLERAVSEKQRALDTAAEAHSECVALAGQVDALKKATLRAAGSQQQRYEQQGARSGRTSPSISHSSNPASSDSHATVNIHDAPNRRSSESPQAQNLKSRSTTSPQSVPNVTPPVLSFSPDVLPEYYQEDNANPPSARASESRFSPGSSSDSDPGLNATPARRIGLHEQSANTGVDAHDKSAELPAQSETERRQIQPQAPITTFSRRRVIESDSDTSPIVRPVPRAAGPNAATRQEGSNRGGKATEGDREASARSVLQLQQGPKKTVQKGVKGIERDERPKFRSRTTIDSDSD